MARSVPEISTYFFGMHLSQLRHWCFWESVYHQRSRIYSSRRICTSMSLNRFPVGEQQKEETCRHFSRGRPLEMMRTLCIERMFRCTGVGRAIYMYIRYLGHLKPEIATPVQERRRSPSPMKWSEQDWLCILDDQNLIRGSEMIGDDRRWWAAIFSAAGEKSFNFPAHHSTVHSFSCAYGSHNESPWTCSKSHQ